MCKIKDTIIEEQDKVVDITKEVFYNKETMQIENVKEMTQEEADELFYKTHDCLSDDVDLEQARIDEWIVDEGIKII